MAVAWPATLPAPIANSVKLHTQKNTRTIEFSAKNRRTTTRSSKPPSIVECDISMDSVQLDAFDYFIKFDLRYGAHWIDANWLLALGFSAHFARFLELPKINKRGGRFTLSCVFEIVLQSVAIQMPTAEIYKTSNLKTFQIPTQNLIATYDASNQLSANYAPNSILPDSFGAGFKLTNSGYSAGFTASSVVSLNGHPAIRLYNFKNPTYTWYNQSQIIESQNNLYAGGSLTTMIAVAQNHIELNGIVYSSSDYSFSGWYGNKAVFTHTEDSTTNTARLYVNGGLVNTVNIQNFNRSNKPSFGKKYPSQGYEYRYFHECMLWHGANTISEQQHLEIVSHLMTKWLIV